MRYKKRRIGVEHFEGDAKLHIFPASIVPFTRLVSEDFLSLGDHLLLTHEIQRWIVEKALDVSRIIPIWIFFGYSCKNLIDKRGQTSEKEIYDDVKRRVLDEIREEKEKKEEEERQQLEMEMKLRQKIQDELEEKKREEEERLAKEQEVEDRIKQRLLQEQDSAILDEPELGEGEEGRKELEEKTSEDEDRGTGKAVLAAKLAPAVVADTKIRERRSSKAEKGVVREKKKDRSKDGKLAPEKQRGRPAPSPRSKSKTKSRSTPRGDAMVKEKRRPQRKRNSVVSSEDEESSTDETTSDSDSESGDEVDSAGSESLSSKESDASLTTDSDSEERSDVSEEDSEEYARLRAKAKKEKKRKQKEKVASKRRISRSSKSTPKVGSSPRVAADDKIMTLRKALKVKEKKIHEMEASQKGNEMKRDEDLKLLRNEMQTQYLKLVADLKEAEKEKEAAEGKRVAVPGVAVPAKSMPPTAPEATPRVAQKTIPPANKELPVNLPSEITSDGENDAVGGVVGVQKPDLAAQTRPVGNRPADPQPGVSHPVPQPVTLEQVQQKLRQQAQTQPQQLAQIPPLQPQPQPQPQPQVQTQLHPQPQPPAQQQFAQSVNGIPQPQVGGQMDEKRGGGRGFTRSLYSYSDISQDGRSDAGEEPEGAVYQPILSLQHPSQQPAPNMVHSLQQPIQMQNGMQPPQPIQHQLSLGQFPNPPLGATALNTTPAPGNQQASQPIPGTAARGRPPPKVKVTPMEQGKIKISGKPGELAVFQIKDKSGRLKTVKYRIPEKGEKISARNILKQSARIEKEEKKAEQLKKKKTRKGSSAKQSTGPESTKMNLQYAQPPTSKLQQQNVPYYYPNAMAQYNQQLQTQQNAVPNPNAIPQYSNVTQSMPHTAQGMGGYSYQQIPPGQALRPQPPGQGI